jgi:hypothetical protein
MESQCAGTFDYLPIHDFMMGGSIDKIYYSATFPIVINLCCHQERTLKALNYYSLMQYVNDSKREDNQLYTISFFFFFLFTWGVRSAYAHHDYSPRPTGHPASPGAGKAPQG